MTIQHSRPAATRLIFDPDQLMAARRRNTAPTTSKINIRISMPTEVPKKSLKPTDDLRSLLVLVMLVPLRALLLTVSLGILHHEWSRAIPALGFWSCVILSMTFTGLIRR